MNMTLRIVILFLICGLTVSAAFAQADPVLDLRNQIEAAATPQDRIRLQLKLADHLVATGHKSEALQELRLAANSDVFDPIAFYNLGNSLARLGESEAAVAAYGKAIGQRKGQYSRAYNNLGVVLLRLGRWDEAYNALNSALKIENFRYAEASYNLGRVYAARGQSDLAAREWRRALAVDPRHDAAAQALARSNTEERIVVVKSKSPSNPTLSKKSDVSGSESLTNLRPKTLILDQISFDFLQRARNASERGKMLEAVENYRRVLNRENGYFAPANLELGYTLLNLKRPDEAFGHLLQVATRDGAVYPSSYYFLARLYEVRGELKLAEAAFSQAASAYSQFQLDLARVREKQGDFKGAVEAFERYVAFMREQGQKPDGSDQRLAELRAKIK